MAKVVVTEDYYSVLEVPQSATINHIREQYKKLALRFHPDKNKHDTTSDFQKLSIAYETLKDPIRRAEYDREYVRIIEKRKCEEDDEEYITRARRRRQEVDREASAQWARHAEFSNGHGRHHSSDYLPRSEEVMKWKATAREDHLARLRQWEDFRDKHVVMIKDCLQAIRKQKADMERYTKDDEAIEKARASGSDIPGFVEALQKMQHARKLYALSLAQDFKELRNRLQQFLVELEADRYRYEVEEAGIRRERIREALELLGPRDLNPPLFSTIDRRGQGINHWEALHRVKLSAKFPSSLEAYTEGPWHMDGKWERVVGEHTCGRCTHQAFHLHAPCLPAKCPGCGLILCNDCYQEMRLLREYGDWLTSRDGQMLDSLFALEFDLSRVSFRASWEKDPYFGLGLGVFHKM